ncbi:alanine:cation symporter family protein [Subsaximicrobium wynnwilliamsii]|uniref:Alanine:cation symporter family protein n=1 Tax=Subsaximicrobium wynnwilliamsii TaxID=291179 RepID=A0A5C6ZFD9_9FLAO|nr:alanine/glycine:cation symporter family protein [Subsaximicrobium wynnwilliamsii]TXD83034.1 alanine:cation symporter family protein [Subsaximicrobium wynnwilliamsii]TXD88778.1 alanine:cation symporter family protein [Subsaximicrobium wynnwilliamsii]TXE02851.1 alanine:cation symporter family protein [Subsaximicrobium wynnwilliamsii]
MEKLDQIVASFSSLAWGLPLLILLIGGGIYLLIRSQFIPFTLFSHALKVLRGKYDDPNDPGEISHFKALTTALSSTIGMGNIAGVALAIAVGGPGAMFWMWVSAIVGMSTKFFTCTLAVMYRGKDSNGDLQGGPMYFIVEGLGKRWKPLAVMFSAFGMLGALPVVNVNQLKQAVNDILLIPNGVEVNVYSDLLIAAILVVVTSIVILGGIKRISNIASKLVPSMVLLYFILVLIILGMNYTEVPKYLLLIVTDAFEANFIKGDAFLGGMLGALILLGIRRGAFSNEAGIGTAPMAHGAAKTKEPVREGLVAMLGPAIDTLVVCTLTALAILVTGVWQSTSDNGVTLTASAFEDAMPGIGAYALMVCVFVFSISSLFSYSYYGSKCMSFLFGTKHKHIYNYFYILSIILAATTDFRTMINLIDGVFALMAIPTMTATLIMAPRVVKEIKAYRKRFQV